MKKLALLLPAMRVGGAEKIALNFIPILKKHFEVTVVLNKLEGELLDRCLNEVEVVEDRLLTFQEIFKNDLKHLRLIKLFQDIVYYTKVKLGKNNDKNYRYLVSRTPALDKEFDIAISYVANVSTQIFSAIDRIRAKTKIAWIHGETTELTDTKFYGECYDKFDRIFCVSDASRQHFLEKFPSLADKCEVYYNPINTDDIRRRSEEKPEIEYDKNYINLLSVGRITPEKGYDMVPLITKILLDKLHKVRFYIIGDGPSADVVRENIKKYGVEDAVYILGVKTNPYPYMKACDVYVQPSYEEGYSTTICEAGTLGCAIVGTTTSGGIREQVEDGVSALIAEPTPQSIAECIEKIVTDVGLKDKIKKNVSMLDFSNKDQIKKLRQYIGE